MNRFRSHREGSSADDDPTEILRVWRDQQDQERLADTREFPGPIEPASPSPRHRRRVPLLLVAGVGALVVVAGVAIASAADRPTEQGTSGGAVTTAPSTPSSDNPSTATSSPAPQSSDDSSAPAGPGNAPTPPAGGPGGEAGNGADGGPGADAGDVPPAPPGGGPAGGGPGGDAQPPAGPGQDAPAAPGSR